MKSLIIELSRPGTPDNHNLSPDTRYIALCGTYPEVNVSVNCNQLKFFEVVKNLRYSNANPAATRKAVAFCEALVTKLFADLDYPDLQHQHEEPLHIRLVANPMELAQLPFEFVRVPLNPDLPATGAMLTDAGRVVTFTREVRQKSEAGYVWPHVPRVLFAWAQPSETVPFEAHRQALQQVLTPLAKPVKNNAVPEPDLSPFFTELAHASLHSIGKKMQEGISEGRPYTHVNILAHGGHEADWSGFEFQLVLCEKDSTDKEELVSGGRLAEALISDAHVPVVVSLSACDSANVGNVLMPAGSLVYQLHLAGIPCVFASQFPLTQNGSVILVRTLYSELVNGCDPRTALHKTRMTMKEENSHDWASLVAYARFPDDIDTQLQDARLKRLFAGMKISNAWVDHVFRNWDNIEAGKREQIVLQLHQRIEVSIAELSELMADGRSVLKNADMKGEHLGLLGSACKRKAEYLWRLSELTGDPDNDLATQSSGQLKLAGHYYKAGFDAYALSHWNAAQYLSLKAALGESLLPEFNAWIVAEFMAERVLYSDASDGDKFWAMGSLGELHLLWQLAAKEASEEEKTKHRNLALEYVARMQSHGADYNAGKESMVRQLDRYVSWWRQMYPASFAKDLLKTAKEMRAVFPSLDELAT